MQVTFEQRMVIQIQCRLINRRKQREKTDNLRGGRDGFLGPGLTGLGGLNTAGGFGFRYPEGLGR